MRSGVYLFRGRRPGLIGRIPPWVPWVILPAFLLMLHGRSLSLLYGGLILLILPRHNLYVGQSSNVLLRKEAHLFGGGRFKAVRKPWADLHPSHYFLRLPKWALIPVETVAIVLLWPVYNHQKNQWNPRRIPLSSAAVQREQRDRYGWALNMRPIHLFLLAGAGYMLYQLTSELIGL